MIILRPERHWHLFLIVGGLNFSEIAFAQQQQPSSPIVEQQEKSGVVPDIVVTGTRIRGSAIGNVDPVAVLDQNAIRTLGATSLSELLKRVKGLTTSDSGSAPAFLLNGRRISGFGELQSLPPEAMERIEVLPEQEAARFGFPSTVRVMNFITKKRFRALALQELVGTTTQGGGATNYAEAVSTRIDGERRTSLMVSHLRQNPILQSQRGVVPDLDTPFAVDGNVTGIGGASIDPALDLLAGRHVTVAAVPSDPAARRSLDGYVVTANAPSITDIGRYRSLVQSSDTIRVDGTIASAIGRTMNGSLNLTMEAQHGAGLNGLASAILTVPATGVLPFTNDVLLYRYLPGSVLRQRANNLTLHAGGTLQGGINRWTWNVTGTYDRIQSYAYSENGVSLGPLQAAVDAGGDPLAPIDSATALQQTISQSRTVVGTLGAKLVANGPLLRLPAGDVLITASVDYARSVSRSSQATIVGSGLLLGRTTMGASISADVPIASADRDALPFLGTLIGNGMIGISDVSNYGRLTAFNYGLTWAPIWRLQLSASINETPTPPPIALLSSPTFVVPNTPFFDFTTGTSALVTAVSGGNPTLLPERRRVTTIGITLTPIKGKEFRLNFNYVDTRIYNQAGSLGSATEAFQTAFPHQFLRNASGQLIRVNLGFVNLAEEQERKLRFGFDLWTQLGRAVPIAAVAGEPPALSPSSRKPPLSILVNLSATLRTEDSLMLRSGAGILNLLNGATLNGTGGRPRWEAEGNISGIYGPTNISIYGQIQGSTQIRSEFASSDLQFSGRTALTLLASLDLEAFFHLRTMRKTSFQLTLDNILDNRISVKDRQGKVPSRFQPAYIDPIGRSIKIGLRKLF